jgi:hypothetical protein
MAKLTDYATVSTLNDGMWIYTAIDTDTDGDFESRKFSLATLRASMYATNGVMLKLSKGADIASANALTLGADGNYFDVTGTTDITSIDTVQVGTQVTLQFDDALTVTHHATDLITPNGQDMITQAGDHVSFVEYEAGKWRVTYTSIVTELDVVAFIPIAAPTHFEGLVYYDITEKALSYYNDEEDVTINLGQESIVRVYNDTGVAIPDGSIVEITGSTGEFPHVGLAIASSEHVDVLGIATHEIGIAEFGYVTTFGVVRGPTTTGMTAGNVLFLSDTVAGEFTESEPDIANEAVHIGKVVKVDASGKIFVSIHPHRHALSYAALYWSVPIATVLAVATPLKALGTTAAEGLNPNFTVAVDNRLTYTGSETGWFTVAITISVSKGSAGTSQGDHHIYKNGSAVTGATIGRSYTSATDTGSIALIAHVEMAQNDYIELWLENSSGDDTTVQGGTMVVRRIS